MNYEFLNKDGSRYTLMETETPERDLEGIQKYNPDVISYQEYVEPEPEIIPEESVDENTKEESIMEV
jgi:hypothetical protein